MTRLILLGVFCAMCLPVSADVRLPAIFSDHAVLQSGKPVSVWGWADPGESVMLSIAGQNFNTAADEKGAWFVKLPKLTATGALTLTVRGRSNSITVNDVLVGEVWLCSGQSNMEMQLNGLHGGVLNAAQEVAAANYPDIRMFVFDDTYDIFKLPSPPDAPAADRPGHWLICTPDTAARFTAVGYYFARELHQQLNVPVGLVHSSVGGTPVEAWTSLEKQKATPELQPVLDDWSKRLTNYDPESGKKQADEKKQAWQKEKADAVAKGEPAPKATAATVFKNVAVSKPGGLFNGMINPLLPYTLHGVLWYQGERNAAGPFTKLYGLQLQTLISDWRARWGDDLYFAYVQITRTQKEQTLPSESNGWGVWVREGMRQALHVPNTGMAICIDGGGASPADGHPKNKADVGHRLALLALHDVYGKDLPVWSGPLYRSMSRDANKLVLTFDQAKGLRAASGELKGFAIAGPDKKFVWANSSIEGDKVLVWNDALSNPTAVRYDWAANPVGNLRNMADLPASPFRTDNWEN